MVENYLNFTGFSSFILLFFHFIIQCGTFSFLTILVGFFLILFYLAPLPSYYSIWDFFFPLSNYGFDLIDFFDKLPELYSFHANSNNFTGFMPNINVKNNRYLFELNLSNNKLNGQFLMEVLKAKNVTFLDI